MIGEIFPTDAKWCWIDLTGAHEDDIIFKKELSRALKNRLPQNNTYMCSRRFKGAMMSSEETEAH